MGRIRVCVPAEKEFVRAVSLGKELFLLWDEPTDAGIKPNNSIHYNLCPLCLHESVRINIEQTNILGQTAGFVYVGFRD